jgi:hypothetical protein
MPILRPYAHETTLQIILGAAAGLALAEFFKAFVAEFGKKLAEFVHTSVKKHVKSGIYRVELQGIRSFGEFSFGFTVHGSDLVSVTSSFDALAQSLDEAEGKGVISNLTPGDSISLAGDGWEAKVKKINPSAVGKA